ncbi:MAG: hypothetical protein HYY84_13075 [Deltaproteobacteria bacterium]|nr:hypothetical protein [Deltaproteobacteria bacterium]
MIYGRFFNLVGIATIAASAGSANAAGTASDREDWMIQALTGTFRPHDRYSAKSFSLLVLKRDKIYHFEKDASCNARARASCPAGESKTGGFSVKKKGAQIELTLALTKGGSRVYLVTPIDKPGSYALSMKPASGMTIQLFRAKKVSEFWCEHKKDCEKQGMPRLCEGGPSELSCARNRCAAKCLPMGD